MRDKMKDTSHRKQKDHAEKRLIKDYFNNQQEGTFVEVGANEPTSTGSQSWHLESELGWSGVLVEPNPGLAEKARQLRPKAKVFECACTSPEKVGTLTLYIPIRGEHHVAAHASVEINADDFSYTKHHEIKVKARTLDEILAESSVTKIDLLSLDVEGTEMDVLRGLDLSKYHPKLILLEDKFLYLEKHRYLKRNGYKLVKRTKQNNWYVPNEAKRPAQTTSERLKLFKKMYISIILRKMLFAIKSKRMDALTRL
jgi:FkbM family methyltransferase